MSFFPELSKLLFFVMCFACKPFWLLGRGHQLHHQQNAPFSFVIFCLSLSTSWLSCWKQATSLTAFSQKMSELTGLFMPLFVQLCLMLPSQSFWIGFGPSRCNIICVRVTIASFVFESMCNACATHSSLVFAVLNQITTSISNQIILALPYDFRKPWRSYHVDQLRSSEVWMLPFP